MIREKVFLKKLIHSHHSDETLQRFINIHCSHLIGQPIVISQDVYNNDNNSWHTNQYCGKLEYIQVVFGTLCVKIDCTLGYEKIFYFNIAHELDFFTFTFIDGLIAKTWEKYNANRSN